MLTWDAYQVLFADRENNRFFSALWNSLRIGLTSALLTSLLGAGLLIWLERAPLRFRAGLEGMILLPMAFPQWSSEWLVPSQPVVAWGVSPCFGLLLHCMQFWLPLLAPLSPTNLASGSNSVAYRIKDPAHSSSSFLEDGSLACSFNLVAGLWFSPFAPRWGTQFDPDDS